MFDFRPLTLEDLPLVHRFLHAPHAKRWFGQSMADVERDYGASVRGDEAFKTFIVTLEGAAVGFVTFGFFGDYPDMQRAYGVTDPDAANCDVLLAERAHEGRGAVLIRELAERIIFASPRTTTLVIDPLPENAIAIRAYEKAGFRFLRAVPNDGEGNALYLLELDRATFAARAPEPFHIRPGRSSEMDLARRIDDDAVEAFREVGLGDFTFDRGYSEAEVVRWKACADRGRLLFACADGSPVGFIAIGAVDGKPYIDQISCGARTCVEASAALCSFVRSERAFVTARSGSRRTRTCHGTRPGTHASASSAWRKSTHHASCASSSIARGRSSRGRTAKS